MPIEIAPHAGFCMGVRRAVEEAMKVAESGVPSCTLGELAHNPVVVDMLRQRGVPPIHDASQAAGRQVLIRSHGVAPKVLDELRRCGSAIIDLTCPFVDRLHRIVAEGTADGTPVIMVGEKEHPEVRGTCGWAHGEVYVIATAQEAQQLPAMPRAIAAAQTTYPPEKWEEILRVLRDKVTELTEHCTICNATPVRQKEAKELASRADAMIVIGGRSSANTQKLYAACKALCPRTIQVECAAEIPPAFANTDSELLGITAGASTPAGSIEEVYTHMTDMQNTEFTMDVIDASMTRIRPGQTVTGKVVLVSDDAICVNIGYKADGIIKMADLTQENVQEGDEIEAEIVKVNDGDGNVVLSQRNIVNRKAWEALMAKHAEGAYVEGVGKEAVKGGLICDVEGVRAFVPASQLAQHYVEKIGEFVGKDMRLKIIEVDEKKKRIVASRKAVIVEESAAKEKAAWERLEKGVIIHGVVRRLTQFGAFVDVGGVDGLIHITDLSWVRVGHPSEVVKPNQEIDVIVLSLDPERKRIQLGYKQLQPRPWDNAAERYPEGCIVEGKVLRTVEFGAFVELQPGLDGLVHISQCSTQHISKVTDAVQQGQIVRVKVLSVDTEKKRISLSIRQAIEDEVFEEEMEPVADEAEVVEFSSEDAE